MIYNYYMAVWINLYIYVYSLIKEILNNMNLFICFINNNKTYLK